MEHKICDACWFTYNEPKCTGKDKDGQEKLSGDNHCWDYVHKSRQVVIKPLRDILGGTDPDKIYRTGEQQFEHDGPNIIGGY